MASKLVWIRGTAESNLAGVEPVVVYESIESSEWNTMNDEQRKRFVDEVGETALAEIASYGAEVVDESEVPADERATADGGS